MGISFSVLKIHRTPHRFISKMFHTESKINVRYRQYKPIYLEHKFDGNFKLRSQELGAVVSQLNEGLEHGVPVLPLYTPLQHLHRGRGGGGRGRGEGGRGRGEGGRGEGGVCVCVCERGGKGGGEKGGEGRGWCVCVCVCERWEGRRGGGGEGEGRREGRGRGVVCVCEVGREGWCVGGRKYI